MTLLLRLAELEALLAQRDATIKLLDEEKHQALAELMESTSRVCEDNKRRAREAVTVLQDKLRLEYDTALHSLQELLRRHEAKLGSAEEALRASTEEQQRALAAHAAERAVLVHRNRRLEEQLRAATTSRSPSPADKENRGCARASKRAWVVPAPRTYSGASE